MMKEGFSSLDVSMLVKELQTLIGSYIEKIYQTSKDEILIRIKTKNGKTNFLIHSGKYACITKREIKTPETPTTFAMTLRKYLTNKRITGVLQHDFDRIVEFEIGKYRLVAELFSKGNIILLEDSKIILPLSYQRWGRRTIKSGEDYVHPPGKCSALTLSLKDFKKIMEETKKDTVRTLASDLNLGGLYSEEICMNARIDKNKKHLDEEEIKRGYKEFSGLMKRKKKPLIVFKDDKMFDVTPVNLKVYERNRMEEHALFNDAVDKFFSEKEEVMRKEKEVKIKEEAMEKYQYHLRQQENALKKFEKEITENRGKGDLIYENYSLIDKILRERKNLKGFKEVVDENRNEGWVKVLVGETGIKIDVRKNVSENAQYYYKKGKKAKEKLEGVKKSIMLTRGKMEKIGKEKKKKKEEKVKVFWFEKYRWFLSSNNVLVIGGKDAGSNEKIVKRYLKEKDRYAHADIHGAPSVVVKGNDETTLKEACVFSLIFSKAWNIKISSGDAYWVLPEQVSKTPGTGEFVPKGGFIIRGKKNFFRKIKIRAGIGEVEVESVKKLMCAPVSALKKHSKRYTVFEPGETKKTDFAKQLSKVFGYPADRIMGILPPGDVKVTENVGIKT